MAVKFHRCPVLFAKVDGHPCWRVQKALIDMEIPFEIVKEPLMPRSRRVRVIEHTGQSQLPAIEFEDGRWLREPSADLAARIRAGRLFESRSSETAAPEPAATPTS